MPDAAPSPDDKRVFLLLRKTGLDEDEAFTLFAGIRDMAAANLIARFESKLDAQNAKLDAQNGIIAAQNAQLAALRWLIGGGFALLGLLVAALRLFA